jgi:hypothetical protein
MGDCAICALPIAGPRVSGPESGRAFHPACLAQRAPQDAAVALIAVLAVVLVPPLLVWAG